MASCADLDLSCKNLEERLHVQERKMLIERCQEIASAQGIRFSFLSGDVHVCAAGRLYSDPKVISATKSKSE